MKELLPCTGWWLYIPGGWSKSSSSPTMWVYNIVSREIFLECLTFLVSYLCTSEESLDKKREKEQWDWYLLYFILATFPFMLSFRYWQNKYLIYPAQYEHIFQTVLCTFLIISYSLSLWSRVLLDTFFALSKLLHYLRASSLHSCTHLYHIFSCTFQLHTFFEPNIR